MSSFFPLVLVPAPSNLKVLVAGLELLLYIAVSVIIVCIGMQVGKRTLSVSGSSARPTRTLALCSVVFFLLLTVIDQNRFPLRFTLAADLLGLIAHNLGLAFCFFAILLALREARAPEKLSFLFSGTRPSEPVRNPSNTLWLLTGFAFVCCAVAFLEFKWPFYFSQDDNLSVNLAEIVYACRTAFSGIFPTWNPHQLMGAPNTTLGWYALTYPPTYISYWIAKSIIGNEFATLDVFSVFHLLVAYFAIYWAMRREGCRATICVMGAVSCVLSGYALIFSRSWYQFSAVLPWMALLIVCVQSIARGRADWKWILGFGAVIGCSFHAGHIQMWFYNVMLADIAILVLMCTRTIALRRIWAIFTAHFIALALAAPMLVPEIFTLGSVLRRGPMSNGITTGLKNLLLPASLAPGVHPEPSWGIGTAPGMIGEMYYSGTLFILISALLLLLWIASPQTRDRLKSNLWLVMAALCFVLALGKDALLWNLMEYLPLISGFRNPFKFLPYIILFSALAGGLALERWMAQKRSKVRLEFALAALMFTVLAYHVTLCSGAFYVYGFAPYPQPDHNVAAILSPAGGADSRFMPISLEGFSYAYGSRSREPRFIDSFANQWPSVFGGYSFGGYNPLAAETPTFVKLLSDTAAHPETLLREYGVEYIIQHNDPADQQYRRPTGIPGSLVIYSSPNILLEKLPKPRPLAFVTETGEAVPVQFDGGGATIDSSQLAPGTRVTVNVLWWKEFQAKSTAGTIPLSADSLHRTTFVVPDAHQPVRIHFQPEWAYGFLLSLVSLLCAWITGRLASSVNSSTHPLEPASTPKEEAQLQLA